MKRLTLMAACLLIGAVTGAVIMLAVQGASSVEGTDQGTTIVTPVPAASGGSSTLPPPDQGAVADSVPTSDQVLLVWTPAGLPVGLADRVASLEGVSAVTTVQGDLVHLLEAANALGDLEDGPRDGYVIPLELIAFDPNTYLPFVPKQESVAFTELSAGEIILGSTSAGLRGLGPGGILTLEDGTVLEVAAVVPDTLIGAAEGAVTAGESAGLGIAVERYLLIRYSGPRTEIESAVRGELPEGLAVRIRAPGETPVLRHGDAVQPQVLIKERFGEFAYRPDGDATFEIHPDWVDANIVTTRVPLLGSVTCHRNILPALTGAMEELEKRNLSFLVDPDGFGGCFNPRYIGGGRGISRHAWGAAVDINLVSNPEGLESVQDPRLVDVMERWGFTSGHDWLIPDPGHFEFVQPPSPTRADPPPSPRP